MKITSLSILIFTLVSCKSNTDFCKCIEAGQKVNELSASFFNREYSELGKDSLDNVIQYRDELCEPFSELSPEELQKEKQQCSQLLIELPENSPNNAQ